MVNFTYSALVAVLHERLFWNALQLRLHKQKLKIYLTSFGTRKETADSRNPQPIIYSAVLYGMGRPFSFHWLKYDVAVFDSKAFALQLNPS